MQKINFTPKISFLFVSLLAACLAACQSAEAAVLASPTPGVTATTLTITTTQPSVVPTDTATPTPTQTELPPTATLPPPTLTASPTATPTPRGALTWEQQRLLDEISLSFVADTDEKANEFIREKIDYLPGPIEDSSLMCGPFAAYLLREIGVLPPDTDLHAFWLLNPRIQPIHVTLEKYFTADRFTWYHFDTQLDEMDFNAFPLLPGDFLYTYAGRSGTFDHMMIITRVDELGRVYTVSNINSKAGFVIRAMMLYDPTQPGVGQIYDWDNFSVSRKYGMTGSGGFELLRLITPTNSSPPKE